LVLLLALCACAPAAAATPAAPAATVAPSAAPAPTAAAVEALPAAVSTPLAEATPAGASPAVAASAGVAPTVDPSAGATPTAVPEPRLAAARWQEWPVIPLLSARARQILTEGAAKGANPRAFAKVGDCETLTDWFLVDFDRGARYYDLGPYVSLQRVIDYYAGSFQRKSAASARGFTAASALSSIWADPKLCQAGETPLACEYRLQKPALAFIMLGTNDVNHKATFEANLRKILDQSLERGILPVLVTKADNLEGDGSLNLTIARLAYEYDLPLWNYWRAVQALPGGGLQPDGAHLTYAPNRFNDPSVLLTAWPLRNLTALQVLEVVMGK
jgi:hypothetical protein